MNTVHAFSRRSAVRRPLLRTLAAAAALGLAMVTVLGLGWVQAASAHAALLGSDPRDGAKLDAVPARISLEFSEDMSAPAYIVVTAPDGGRITSGEVGVDGPKVGVALTDPGLPGSYTVAFRAVSADGHPVTGQFAFSVAGAASPSAGAAGSPGAPSSAAPSAAASGDASASPSAAAAASGAAGGDSSDGGADGDSGVGLGEVQVGVGVGLFAAAGGLFWWSRRKQQA